MRKFDLFTIIPSNMRTIDALALAKSTGRMLITNGRSCMLAPKLLPGYRKIHCLALRT